MVATWGLNGTTLTVRLLERVAPSAVTALRTDAADVLQFLDRAPGEVVIES